MSRQDLEESARRGELARDDRVRKEGTDLWLPARRIAGLFASTADETTTAESEPPAAPTGSEASKPELRPLRSMQSILSGLSGLLSWRWAAGIAAVVGIAIVAVLGWDILVLTGPRFPEPRMLRDAGTANREGTSAAFWPLLEKILIACDVLLAIGVVVFFIRRRSMKR